jgi:2'-5' RNA ligase
MRLFVGLELDASVVRTLEQCTLDVRWRVENAAPHARLSWVPADRIHVTVRFIGHVDETRGSAIAAALAPEIDQSPFEMHIRGVGTFPLRGAPRVFWAGVHASPHVLEDLERRVTERLAPFGIAGEQRPYQPHITLARVREGKGLRASALTEGHERRDFGSSMVEAITLFESRPSTEGVRYVPVVRPCLAAARR